MMEITFRDGDIIKSYVLDNIKKYRVSYRISPFVQWKTLIASESKKVRRGKVEVIEVEPVSIAPNTILAPLSIMRHAYGTVVDVIEDKPSMVENEKKVEKAVFLAVEDGTVEEGDLIGVIQVLFVKVGTLSKILGFVPKDIKIREEFKNAYIVYDDGSRRKVRMRLFGYVASNIAEWRLVVAEEDLEVEKGGVYRINIRPIELQPCTVVTPLTILRHPLGSVVDVIEFGRSKVEESKLIKQAIFVARKDGIIEKGDLIGVLNVYHVAIGNFESGLLKRSLERVNIVVEKNGRIEKKNIEVRPFVYRRKSTAKWDLLLSNENVEVREGELAEIEIKPLKIEKNAIVCPLCSMRNAIGTVLDVVGTHGKVEEEKRIDRVLFLPVYSGTIKKNQLLGVLNIYNVEVKPYEVLDRLLRDWRSRIRSRVVEV